MDFGSNGYNSEREPQKKHFNRIILFVTVILAKWLPSISNPTCLILVVIKLYSNVFRSISIQYSTTFTSLYFLE